MRITVIAPTEIPARRANTIQVMKMTQAFAVLGHEVHLVAPQIPSQNKKYIPLPERWGGEDPGDWEMLAELYGLRKRFPITFLQAWSGFRRYDFSLQAVLLARRRKSNLIYTRLPQAATLSSFLGLPTILEAHDLPQGRMGPILFRLYLGSRGALRLVLITSALEKDLVHEYGIERLSSGLIIAPDGVDLERYEAIPPPLEARAILIENRPGLFSPNFQRFTAGYTGHLYMGRGAELIIELAKRLPEINFLIVGGEEPDVLRLKSVIAEMNLANISITGFVPNASLPLYQAACDVLLMPYQKKVAASSGGDISRYLSPLKLFEYLACARPIISSNLPVFSEILNERNAILLEGAEVESWAESLVELQYDANKRSQLSAQARQDAQDYTWEKRAKAILEGIE